MIWFIWVRAASSHQRLRHRHELLLPHVVRVLCTFDRSRIVNQIHSLPQGPPAKHFIHVFLRWQRASCLLVLLQKPFPFVFQLRLAFHHVREEGGAQERGSLLAPF